MEVMAGNREGNEFKKLLMKHLNLCPICGWAEKTAQSVWYFWSINRRGWWCWSFSTSWSKVPKHQQSSVKHSFTAVAFLDRSTVASCKIWENVSLFHHSFFIFPKNLRTGFLLVHYFLLWSSIRASRSFQMCRWSCQLPTGRFYEDWMLENVLENWKSIQQHIQTKFISLNFIRLSSFVINLVIAAWACNN